MFAQFIATFDVKWIGLSWIRIKVIVGFWFNSVGSLGSNSRVSCLFNSVCIC